MAKIACCFNCVYSYCDHEHALWSMSVGVLTWPACANQPEAPGRMQRVPQRGICRNYRPRPATPEGDVKQIPLGAGVYAYVDAADFDWLNQWNWHLRNGYAARCEKGKVILMHREIMQPPKGRVVDHKNHNKLDDTRVNLRTCTRGENARNHAKRGNTSSRFIGVYYCKDRDKWRAEIQCEGKPTFLGYFTKEIEAARAHDRAAVEYFGEFAPLNFPQEWPPQRRAQVYAQAEEQRRRIAARRRPAGRKDRRRTASRKPRSAGRKKAATKRTGRSRTQRPAQNEKSHSAAFGRNRKRSSHKGTKTQRRARRTPSGLRGFVAS